MGTRSVFLLACAIGAVLGAVLMLGAVPDTGPDVPDGPVLSLPVSAAPVVAPRPAPVVVPKPSMVAPAPEPEPEPEPEPSEDIDAFFSADDLMDDVYTSDITGIARAVKHRDPLIQACYQTHRELQGGLEPGKMLLAFTITPLEDDPQRGRVTKVRIDADEPGPVMFEGCLASVFEEIPFRRTPGGKPLDMRWPVFLK